MNKYVLYKLQKLKTVALSSRNQHVVLVCGPCLRKQKEKEKISDKMNH